MLRKSPLDALVDVDNATVDLEEQDTAMNGGAAMFSPDEEEEMAFEVF